MTQDILQPLLSWRKLLNILTLFSSLTNFKIGVMSFELKHYNSIFWFTSSIYWSKNKCLQKWFEKWKQIKFFTLVLERMKWAWIMYLMKIYKKGLFGVFWWILVHVWKHKKVQLEKLNWIDACPKCLSTIYKMK